MCFLYCGLSVSRPFETNSSQNKLISIKKNNSAGFAILISYVGSPWIAFISTQLF